MGQDQILDLLEVNPDQWFTSADFSKIINVNVTSITCNLAKIRRSKLAECKYEKKPGTSVGTWYYKLKRSNSKNIKPGLNNDAKKRRKTKNG